MHLANSYFHKQQYQKNEEISSVAAIPLQFGSTIIFDFYLKFALNQSKIVCLVENGN